MHTTRTLKQNEINLRLDINLKNLEFRVRNPILHLKLRLKRYLVIYTIVKYMFHYEKQYSKFINPLNPELNPICYLLALLGAHHFLHVSRIRVKLLNFRLLMSYIYVAPILDVSRSHTTTQHSR